MSSLRSLQLVFCSLGTALVFHQASSSFRVSGLQRLQTAGMQPEKVRIHVSGDQPDRFRSSGRQSRLHQDVRSSSTAQTAEPAGSDPGFSVHKTCRRAKCVRFSGHWKEFSMRPAGVPSAFSISTIAGLFEKTVYLLHRLICYRLRSTPTRQCGNIRDAF